MKTKRTLIISSAIMALVLVVTIVSVSAAWFGDIKHAEHELNITSSRPSGEARIDLESANSLNDGTTKLVPAKAVDGDLLGGKTPPTGATLQTVNTSLGIASAANVVNIYFPFKYSGSADTGATDHKKSVKIWIDTAYLSSDLHYDSTQQKYVPNDSENIVNYLDEFYITLDVVGNVRKEGNVISYDVAEVEEGDGGFPKGTATKSGNTVTFSGLDAANSIYFVNDIEHKVLYLLLPPGLDYYSVKVGISYNYIDEELNPATMNQRIMFGIKIEALDSRTELIDGIKDLSNL